jgi:hypothetical protein
MVSGGMAFGALFGMTIVSEAALQEGPAGDAGGAAGALLVGICVPVGFVMAMLTIIVAKVLRRPAPDLIGLRLCLSIVGGGVIGALAVDSGPVVTVLVWLILLGVPVLLSWSWPAKAVSGAGR